MLGHEFKGDVEKLYTAMGVSDGSCCASLTPTSVTCPCQPGALRICDATRQGLELESNQHEVH